ncbi:hypothetical protein H312_02192 [Anncaliia algerae PRA339]|uniref:Uncharacterized protein n=1 Tax=Anncaliia algerae PRA339 TaxID=1288291 RepID=A0A059EZB4_9MICR|nr:hypothetical protein H312_02192 [Anncaliia algerae PRA339]
MIDKNNSTFLPEEYNYNENQSSLNNKIIRITNAIIRMRTIFEILIILKSLYSFINYNEAYYFFTLIFHKTLGSDMKLHLLDTQCSLNPHILLS